MTGISLNTTSTTIEVGNTYKLTATISPSNATDKTVTWSSSNTSVATVSGGTVTGKAAGTATITAKTGNGKTATCSVTVKNPIVAVTGISLNTTSTTIEVGNTYKLTATISPSNATDKTVTWSSSNTSVATVSGGTVTGKAAGTATITAKTDNGKTATCNVSVKNPTVEVTGIKLNESNRFGWVGKTYTLTATISPSNATDKTVTWSSSNSNVATVSGGVVTGKSEGIATITAKTNNGIIATCIFTIQYAEMTSVEINHGEDVFVEVGRTISIGSSFEPDNYNPIMRSWSSSDQSVATIKGKEIQGTYYNDPVLRDSAELVAKKVGTTNVTVRFENGKSATCVVHVVERVEGFLVKKVNGQYINITGVGNSEAVTLKQDTDLYIKMKVDYQKCIGGELEVAVRPSNLTRYDCSSQTVTMDALYVDSSGYCYFPIKWKTYYQLGEKKIFYMLTTSTGAVLHPRNWDFDDCFYVKFTQ